MNKNNINYKSLLAQARAIHLAMYRGVLTYEQAKERTRPILDIINRRVRFIGREHNVIARLIKFQDIGRTL